MKHFVEVSEKEAEKDKTAFLIETLDRKTILVREVKVTENVKYISKKELEKLTEAYLNEKHIVRERPTLGKIFQDALTMQGNVIEEKAGK